jgi:hypothetical protein
MHNCSRYVPGQHLMHRPPFRDPRHTRTTREETTQRFSHKVMWPPMALRIGLLRRSALQNDGLDVPVILQCRTHRETNPKGHLGPNYFLRKSWFLFPPWWSWYALGPSVYLGCTPALITFATGTLQCIGPPGGLMHKKLAGSGGTPREGFTGI